MIPTRAVRISIHRDGNLLRILAFGYWRIVILFWPAFSITIFVRVFQLWYTTCMQNDSLANDFSAAAASRAAADSTRREPTLHSLQLPQHPPSTRHLGKTVVYSIQLHHASDRGLWLGSSLKWTFRRRQNPWFLTKSNEVLIPIRCVWDNFYDDWTGVQCSDPYEYSTSDHKVCIVCQSGEQRTAGKHCAY